MVVVGDAAEVVSEVAVDDMVEETHEVVDGRHKVVAEAESTAVRMEIVHIIVQNMRRKVRATKAMQPSRTWWEVPPKIVIDIVGTNVEKIETIK